MPATDCGTHLEVSPNAAQTLPNPLSQRSCSSALTWMDGTSGDGTGDAAFAVPGSKARMQAVLDEAAVPERPGERPGDGSDGEESAVIQKIKKALERALHKDANEQEAAVAMRRAQQMLQQHNLTQAEVLASGSSAPEGLQGGMSRVFLCKTKKPDEAIDHSQPWMHSLADAMTSCFAVRYFFYEKGCEKGSYHFYGIKSKTQLAAFAFARLFNICAAEAASFEVADATFARDKQTGSTQYKTKSAYTANARQNFSLGFARGVKSRVECLKERERLEQLQMLEQARQQALMTEATTSVDTGDAPIIEDGSDVESGSDAGNDHAALDGGDACGDHVPPQERTPQERVAALEHQQRLEQQLVVHDEAVQKRVLEEAGITFAKSRRRTRTTEHNTAAYSEGKRVGEDQDVHQRSIKDRMSIQMRQDPKRKRPKARRRAPIGSPSCVHPPNVGDGAEVNFGEDGWLAGEVTSVLEQGTGFWLLEVEFSDDEAEADLEYPGDEVRLLGPSAPDADEEAGGHETP